MIRVWSRKKWKGGRYEGEGRSCFSTHETSLGSEISPFAGVTVDECRRGEKVMTGMGGGGII